MGTSWGGGELGWLWSLHGGPPSTLVLAEPGLDDIISAREVMLRPRECRRLTGVVTVPSTFPLTTDALAPVSTEEEGAGGGGDVVSLTGRSICSTNWG